MPNIIILDDDIDFSEALLESLALITDDYHFIACSHANQLFHLMKSISVALVITDIIMPDIEGIEVITKVKEMQPELPIIAMSGGGRINSSNNYLHIAKAIGAAATFEKPLSVVALSSKIEELLAA